MESSFQLMIAYDMFYYVKFTALSIKTSYLQGSISFSFKDISSLLRYAIVKSSIYFNIGFKLNGKFFSTYDSF